MQREEADAGVIEACQRGEREAFRQLFETYKDSVYAIALHFARDEAVACDVTQQVFLKLYSTIGQFQGNSRFSTWLFRIVANTVTDERRKARRLVPITERPEMTAHESRRPQEERYLKKEIQESVRDAVADLSPKLQMPILLRYIEELSYEEIADVLGCSMGTVASRLNRGHKALARRLGHLQSVLVREVH